MIPVTLRVEGAGGQTVHATIAAVDQGILNLRANFERTINKNSLIGVRGNFGHVRNNMTQGTSPLGSMSTLKAMTEAAPMRNTVKYGSQLDDTAEGWLSAYDDEASQYFVQQSLYFKAALTEGLTFDVAGGIDYREAQLIMEMVADTGRMGSLDIVELNPALDVRNRTAELAVDLIESLFGKSTLMRKTPRGTEPA